MGLTERVRKMEESRWGAKGCLFCRGAVQVKDILEGEDLTPNQCPKCGLKGMVVIVSLNKARK